jgi:hypothetical protein
MRLRGKRAQGLSPSVEHWSDIRQASNPGLVMWGAGRLPRLICRLPTGFQLYAAPFRGGAWVHLPNGTGGL